MIQLGKWFDYLRENGVYDNTRIIIVGDHGVNMDVIDELLIDNGRGGIVDIGRYNPLLLVKDFGSTGFSISQEFMTNADVPTLAVAGLIADPVNPFTGKQINNNEKYAHAQLVFLSDKWDIKENNGNAFLPDTWASVSGAIWEAASWCFNDNEMVLTEHALP